MRKEKRVLVDRLPENSRLWDYNRTRVNLPLVANVRCSGKIHKFVLSRNLSISFPHRKRDELLMEQLGGEKCRCMVLLDAVVKCIRHDETQARKKLPHASWRAVTRALYRVKYSRSGRWNQEHQLENTGDLKEYLEKPSLWRIPRESLIASGVRRAFEAAVKQSRFRDIPVDHGDLSIWAGATYRYGPERGGMRSTSSNWPRPVEKPWKDIRTAFRGELLLRWYTDVWMKGLAIINGHLVLEVLPEDRYRVIVQTKDGRFCDAIVGPKTDEFTVEVS